MQAVPKQRLHYLDAARGIAAFMVAVYHFIGWGNEDKLAYNIASMVFNGSDAVSFFFVLSGLVLSYKYFHPHQSIQLKSYVVKRIFRLYPAFILTLLINFTLGYDWPSFFEEVVLVKSVDFKIFIPAWTLGIEMALSLLLPFFIIAAQQNVKYLWYALPICLLTSHSHISTFMFHFILGCLIAYYFEQIKNTNIKQQKWYKYRYGIVLITFMLFTIRHWDRAFHIPANIMKILSWLHIDLFTFTAIASAIIILFIINNKNAQHFLNQKPLLFLGKISYSVYLCHWYFVIKIMANWDKLNLISTAPSVKFALGLALHLTCTFLMATLMYYFIEKPFIQMSNRLIKKWAWAS